jgi:hypothetical protein
MKSKADSQNMTDQANQMLTLKRVIGFTSKTCPDIKIIDDRVFFACGKNLISANVS